MKNDIKMNGIQVTRRGDAIFVPLPREMWRSSGGGCTCGKCYGTGYWDTLAIAQENEQPLSHDRTWTVHYPELQPYSVREALRAEAELRDAKVEASERRIIAMLGAGEEDAPALTLEQIAESWRRRKRKKK